jgi:hypothetical protein
MLLTTILEIQAVLKMHLYMKQAVYITLYSKTYSTVLVTGYSWFVHCKHSCNFTTISFP